MRLSALLLGFASLMDFTGSLRRYPRRSLRQDNPHAGWQADAEALRSDWRKVMDQVKL
jgi:hypothetical protein